MEEGVLDMLCIIPRSEIEKYGIPFLQAFLQEGANGNTIEKWDAFWVYFSRQWLPIVESWNICGENDEILECRNRTNNAVECYNRRFNDLFPAKPSLLTFVKVLETESRAQATRLDEIRSGKRRPNVHKDLTIPKEHAGYTLQVGRKLLKGSSN